MTNTYEKRGGKRKGAGRPKSDDPASVQVGIRMTKDQHAMYVACADQDDQDLSDWIRTALLQKLDREMSEVPADDRCGAG